MNNQASYIGSEKPSLPPQSQVEEWTLKIESEINRTQNLGKGMVERFGRVLTSDVPVKAHPPMTDEPLSPLALNLRRLALDLRDNNDAIEQTIERCAV